MVKYHRKRSTRKRSTLSNYRIATKTSAKAQSRQIYALKKRVSRIYRMTKPEIRIQQRVGSGLTITESSTGVFAFNTSQTGSATAITPILNYFGDSSTDTSTSGPINRFARLRSFSLYGQLQYGTITATAKPISVRIVIVQTKMTRDEDITAADIFSSLNDQPSNFQAVYGPLQVGLSRTCKVLSDKRYILSYQRPNVTIRTNLKYLTNYYRDFSNSSSGSTSSESVAKGAIYVAYAVTGSGLTDNPGLLVNSYKLAFTDN